MTDFKNEQQEFVKNLSSLNSFIINEHNRMEATTGLEPTNKQPVTNNYIKDITHRNKEISKNIIDNKKSVNNTLVELKNNAERANRDIVLKSDEINRELKDVKQDMQLHRVSFTKGLREFSELTLKAGQKVTNASSNVVRKTTSKLEQSLDTASEWQAMKDSFVKSASIMFGGPTVAKMMGIGISGLKDIGGKVGSKIAQSKTVQSLKEKIFGRKSSDSEDSSEDFGMDKEFSGLSGMSIPRQSIAKPKNFSPVTKSPIKRQSTTSTIDNNKKPSSTTKAIVPYTPKVPEKPRQNIASPMMTVPESPQASGMFGNMSGNELKFDSSSTISYEERIFAKLTGIFNNVVEIKEALLRAYPEKDKDSGGVKDVLTEMKEGFIYGLVNREKLLLNPLKNLPEKFARKMVDTTKNNLGMIIGGGLGSFLGLPGAVGGAVLGKIIQGTFKGKTIEEQMLGRLNRIATYSRQTVSTLGGSPLINNKGFWLTPMFKGISRTLEERFNVVTKLRMGETSKILEQIAEGNKTKLLEFDELNQSFDSLTESNLLVASSIQNLNSTIRYTNKTLSFAMKKSLGYKTKALPGTIKKPVQDDEGSSQPIYGGNIGDWQIPSDSMDASTRLQERTNSLLSRILMKNDKQADTTDRMEDIASQQLRESRTMSDRLRKLRRGLLFYLTSFMSTPLGMLLVGGGGILSLLNFYKKYKDDPNSALMATGGFMGASRVGGRQLASYLVDKMRIGKGAKSLGSALWKGASWVGSKAKETGEKTLAKLGITKIPAYLANILSKSAHGQGIQHILSTASQTLSKYTPSILSKTGSAISNVLGATGKFIAKRAGGAAGGLVTGYMSYKAGASEEEAVSRGVGATVGAGIGGVMGGGILSPITAALGGWLGDVIGGSLYRLLHDTPIGRFVNHIYEFFKWLIGNMVNAITWPFRKIWEGISNTWNTLYRVVTKPMEVLSNLKNNIIEQVTGVLKWIPDWLLPNRLKEMKYPKEFKTDLGEGVRSSLDISGARKYSDASGTIKVKKSIPNQDKSWYEFWKPSHVDIEEEIPDFKSKLADKSGFLSELVRKIKRHEGYRKEPYRDGHGWSFGYGHNVIGKQKPNITISKTEAENLLIKDLVTKYIPGTRKLIPHFDELDPYKQMAFIDMTYNMGTHWLNKWPNTKNAIENLNFQSVIHNIKNSKYATQVGNRANENIALISKMGLQSSNFKEDFLSSYRQNLPKVTPEAAAYSYTLPEKSMTPEAAAYSYNIPDQGTDKDTIARLETNLQKDQQNLNRQNIQEQQKISDEISKSNKLLTLYTTDNVSNNNLVNLNNNIFSTNNQSVSNTNTRTPTPSNPFDNMGLGNDLGDILTGEL